MTRVATSGLRLREEAAGHDLGDVVVRLLRVEGRDRRRQCGRDVEQPEPRAHVEAGDVDVLRRRAQQVGQLRHAHRAADGPDPRGGGRDDRRREARAALQHVGSRIRRVLERQLLARRGEVDSGARGREDRRCALAARRSDRQHVWIAGGIESRIPRLELVPGSGDHERARSDCAEDRLVLGPGGGRAAEAHVDHAGPGRDGGLDARDHRRVGEVGQVIGPDEGQRVDALGADAVDRGGRGRADGGAVVPVGEAPDVLRVEIDRVGAAGEVRVGQIDAAVDDRDRKAGAWRLGGVRADRVEVVAELGRREGIGETDERIA